mgnify:CR=1 FL=1
MLTDSALGDGADLSPEDEDALTFLLDETPTTDKAEELFQSALEEAWLRFSTNYGTGSDACHTLFIRVHTQGRWCGILQQRHDALERLLAKVRASRNERGEIIRVLKRRLAGKKIWPNRKSPRLTSA